MRFLRPLWCRVASRSQLGDAWVIDKYGCLYGEHVRRMLAHPSWGYGKRGDDPTCIVWHYTATDAGSGVRMHRRRRRRFDRAVDRAASWHFTIERSGEVLQMHPTSYTAWHAGKATYHGRSVNRYGLGIELVGRGKRFTNAQEDASCLLLDAIVSAYPNLTPDDCALLHSNLDPKRRSDPGPIWESVHLPRVLDYTFPNRE